jgi:4'-phosphopantetheinyl transferase
LSIRADLKLLDGVLPNNEVHVWRADLRLGLSYATSLLALLDPAEQDRAARFKVQHAREQFVVSHVFLRLLLSRYLQVEPANLRYRLTTNGKPELVGDVGIRFNLSHTDGAAAVAICRDRAVGIDVERIRDDMNSMELASRFFSKSEVQWLSSQPASEQHNAFFACWTAKEALLKGWGTGFSTSLASFTVVPYPSEAQITLEIHDDHLPENWLIWQLNFGPELRAAVALEGNHVTIRCGDWVWE